jgi:ankyrin repeat protein
LPILGIGQGQDFSVSELSYAAFEGHVAELDKLLRQGAPVNEVDAQGHTAAYYALRGNQREAAETLFQRGGTAFRDFPYLLNRAARLGVLSAIPILIAAGAEPNAREGIRQESALTSAVESGSAAAVECMIANGADVNSPGLDGLLPLHLAAKLGHLEVLTTLVKRGAAVNATDESGRSALEVAIVGENALLSEDRRQQVIKTLKSMGGKILPPPSIGQRITSLIFSK